ncbi:hypothetical protein RclHR1_03560008 [Rhizophagus clarus]|uniref:Uncharacterized protein n=1 Tax=Rhizophagus clarus TaxID=94130 RepID=A0A2Z6RBP3_9GLOM|nr:hypothetical protein RclHR1_03560008 [Rhizophagus clarus]GET01453.1 hypothetical protein GLOIN_2v1655297 [Rhizophagus clarus]
MNKRIDTFACFFVPTLVISIFCVLSLVSFFFYLVGTYYPFAETQPVYENGVEIQNYAPGWLKSEQTAFIVLFVLGGIFFILAFISLGMYDDANRGLNQGLNQGLINPRLMKLNKILYFDEEVNFPQLKEKVIKLKSNELEPQLRAYQTRLMKLIAILKNKVNNDVKAIIDLYLQAHAQMITQEKENDTFAQSQLTNFEDALQSHLIKEELKTLRRQQKETLALEKHLNNLNNLLGRTR